MPAAVLDLRPMDDLGPAADPVAWVWDGILARGDIHLLTGVWKTGKTTLLAGFLHALGGGGEFLGRRVAAGTAVVASEETAGHWADRRAAIPVGPHARLASRPFPGRPTAAEWDSFVRAVEDLPGGRPDVFAADPLASFVPGRGESDPATVLDFLRPLRRLAGRGCAVLVLHHPRRERSEDGSLARGGGALLGAVDAALELRPDRRAGTATRRRLTARSRRPGAVAGLVYEWEPGTAAFREVPDDPAARFREDWAVAAGLLADRPRPAALADLLGAWPPGVAAPSRSVLYDVLRRATGLGLAVRTGGGTKRDPFRFALPRPTPAGGLPPLGPPGR